ncbi:MAG: aminopeptidase P family N-terminal domain-containing protein, partial [Gemmatimonadota bacterium]
MRKYRGHFGEAAGLGGTPDHSLTMEADRMFSRRKFLTTSSLALAGTACATRGSEASAAQGDGDHGGGGSGGALPPAIAALTSMKDQAKPITVEERRARIEKARRLMTEQKIDALMLTGGTSMVYFTGMNW